MGSDQTRRFRARFSSVLGIGAAEAVVAVVQLLQFNQFRGRQIPALPFRGILRTREQSVAGMLCLAQPCDESHQILLSHSRTTCRRPIYSATDVKENRTAIPWHRWIRVVANLNQPAIGEVAAAHFFMAVIVGWITWIDYHVSIIIRRAGI